MPGSKSDYAERVVLDLLLGAVAWTPPGTVYVALSTAAYSDAATGASMTEVSGGAYARASVANTTANWPAASGTPTTKANASAITFPAATAAWGTVRSFYVCDAATGGNVLVGGDLASAKDVVAGDVASFAAGLLAVTED